MSLFGAMNTAVSGLSAQSAAFSNISDNVANSQTVGYKRVDTSFEDYLTVSQSTVNQSGAVVAKPEYVNNVQGNISQSDNTLALAIAGQGFFAVSETNGVGNNNLPSFSQQQYYTRDGDFQLDKNGYLVNSSGEYLNGWSVDSATGTVDRNTVSPIQVTQTSYNPQPTKNMTVSANLPASATSPTSYTSPVDVYDSTGTLRSLNVTWTAPASGSPNTWNVSVDDGLGNTSSHTVTFDQNGLISGIDGQTGTVNSAAAFSFSSDFGGALQSAQAININLGNFGQTNGVTQFAAKDYQLKGTTQDGVPPGAFSSVTMEQTGDVVVNYDNGQSKVIARVPVVTFNSPDQLQRQNGQAFTVTSNSGSASANDAGANGSGSLVTSSVEGSNVDIATEFTNLIVAQRAYSANAKMVTTADDMLQETIDMKR